MFRGAKKRTFRFGKKNVSFPKVETFRFADYIWSEFPNFDPESSQGNNNMTGAFERYSMPQTSSYGFGVNVKF